MLKQSKLSQWLGVGSWWWIVEGCEQAPFSQATLVRFRQALIIHQLDRRLIERTVELAFQSKKLGGRQLRAALDSSPLWGAAKVEDTYNLLGHALLAMVLGVLSQIETHLAQMPETKSHPVVRSSLEAAQQIKVQDVELDQQGSVKLQKGVAKNRRITIEDQEMRHGWKGETAFIYL